MAAPSLAYTFTTWPRQPRPSELGKNLGQILTGLSSTTAGWDISVLSVSAGSLSLTTPLPATSGGTGLGSYAIGDLLYADTTTTLAKLADIAAGGYLRSGGVNTAPAWQAAATLSKVDDTNVTLTLTGAPTTALLTAAGLTLGWSGTLAATRGGTGTGTTAVGDLLQGDTLNTWSKLASVAAGSWLKSAGITTKSVWSTTTLLDAWTQGDLVTATSATVLGRLAAVAAGSFLRAAGTGTVPAWSTTTIPDTFAINTLPYASAANVLSALAAPGANVVLWGNSGAPSWSTSPTIGTSLSIGSADAESFALHITKAAAAGIWVAITNTTTTGYTALNLSETNSGSGATPCYLQRFGSAHANANDLYILASGTGADIKFYTGVAGTLAATFDSSQGAAFAAAATFAGVGTTASAANAYLDNAASNNLLRSTSAAKYKTDITDVGDGLADIIDKLRPVSYQSLSKADNPKTRFYGFLAEDVAALDPCLVTYVDGRPDWVMYERLIVPAVRKLQLMEARLAVLEDGHHHATHL